MNMNLRLLGREVNETSPGQSPLAGFVVSGSGVVGYARTLLVYLWHRYYTLNMLIGKYNVTLLHGHSADAVLIFLYRD
jgi:hypothetical protein